VKPGPVPGRGNTQQAPHFAIALHARGLLKALMIRAYFVGDPLNETDPLLSSIKDARRRETLLARPENQGQWRLDIRLQRGPHGETETLFLDI
jgi:protocatechuate 3,4-dioxygenase alpha subunit